MHCLLSAAILVLFFLAYLVYAVPQFLLLQQYFERVSELEACAADLHEFTNRDEGGMNAFQRETYWKLLSRDYRKFEDAGLVALGDKLWRAQMLSFAIAIVLIALTVVVSHTACS